MLERSMAVIAQKQTLMDAKQLKRDGHLTTSVDNLARFRISVPSPRFTRNGAPYVVQDVDLWDQALSAIDKRLGAWATQAGLAPGDKPTEKHLEVAQKVASRLRNRAYNYYLKNPRTWDQYLATGQIAPFEKK